MGSRPSIRRVTICLIPEIYLIGYSPHEAGSRHQTSLTGQEIMLLCRIEGSYFVLKIKRAKKRAVSFLKQLFRIYLIRLVTMLLESADQVLGDHLCRTALNLVSFDKMYQLAILK